jgi:hypothetical protein
MSDDSYHNKKNSGVHNGSSFSRSFYNKTTTSTIHLPKHKLNGEGSGAVKTARSLQAISTALDTSIAFNKAGEVLPPKAPAMARVMNSGTAAVSGDHDGD